MRTGTYYLNNNGSRWVTFFNGAKPKVLVIDSATKYCKRRTIEYFESFGNYAVAALRFNGKMIKGFIKDCNGTQVLFVDYKDKY
jgi:ribosomal protein L30E